MAPSPHRALEKAEIAGVLTQYGEAALHAKKAGFDGVEIMAANGHLIDQFLQDNQQQADRFIRRIDRQTATLIFSSKVVGTVASMSGGRSGVGVRLAPSGTYNGMADSHNRVRCFTNVAESLNLLPGSLTCISSSRG